jgi:hypothetical protein
MLSFEVVPPASSFSFKITCQGNSYYEAKGMFCIAAL